MFYFTRDRCLNVVVARSYASATLPSIQGLSGCWPDGTLALLRQVGIPSRPEAF